MGDRHPLAPIIRRCLLIKEKRPDTDDVKITLSQLQSEHLTSLEDTLDSVLHLNSLLKLE